MTLPPLSDAAGITTSCTVSEKLRENKNTGLFCGDAESLLDRMIEQCQKQPTARHPGFGRKLVPYFNNDDNDSLHHEAAVDAEEDATAAESPNEKSTAKHKGEGCCSRGSGKGGGYKRASPRSTRRGGIGGRMTYNNNHIMEENRTRRGRGGLRGERHFGGGTGVPGNAVASVTLLSKKDGGGEVEYAFQSASVCSLFAGPICFNSPPPEALPMPTAVLLAKAMCLS